MIKSALPVLATVALFTAGFTAHAQTIQNASFESPTVGTYLDGAPTSFTEFIPNGGNGSAGVQTFATGGLTIGTAEGNQSLYINPGGATGRGVFQDLGALQASTTYTLTFAAAAGTYQSDIAGGSILANASFYNGTDPSSGTALASVTATLFPADHTFADYTLTYTTGTTVSGDLTLLLSNGNTIGQANFDNIRLTVDTSTVPEPATWAGGVLLLGGVAWTLRCRLVRA